MKGLIACEFSARVRDAFRAQGHDFYSCDLRETEGDPRYHIQADFRSVIQESWDFVGYHWVCRVMANSGVRWLKDNPARWDELDESCEIFNITLQDTRPGYSENPIQHKYAKQRIVREQDQVVQPWWFGDPFFKATCFWYRGDLPLLEKTNPLVPPPPGTPEHKAWSAVHYEAPGPDREKNRSRFFPGMSEAMARRWT